MSILWKTAANTVLVSAGSAAFAPVTGLPASPAIAIAADKAANGVYYAAVGSAFYVSTNSGATFTLATGTLGTSAWPFRVIVHPKVAGDIWVSTDKGLFHSTNSGATFTAVPGITQAWSIALGAPKTTGGYPALYAAANFGDGVGYFRSDDQGTNWVKINDAKFGFGNAGANVIAADWQVYGR